MKSLTELLRRTKPNETLVSLGTNVTGASITETKALMSTTVHLIEKGYRVNIIFGLKKANINASSTETDNNFKKIICNTLSTKPETHASLSSETLKLHANTIFYNSIISLFSQINIDTLKNKLMPIIFLDDQKQAYPQIYTEYHNTLTQEYAQNPAFKNAIQIDIKRFQRRIKKQLTETHKQEVWSRICPNLTYAKSNDTKFQIAFKTEHNTEYSDYIKQYMQTHFQDEPQQDFSKDYFLEEWAAFNTYYAQQNSPTTKTIILTYPSQPPDSYILAMNLDHPNKTINDKRTKLKLDWLILALAGDIKFPEENPPAFTPEQFALKLEDFYREAREAQAAATREREVILSMLHELQRKQEQQRGQQESGVYNFIKRIFNLLATWYPDATTLSPNPPTPPTAANSLKPPVTPPGTSRGSSSTSSPTNSPKPDTRMGNNGLHSCTH